jgi:hypothetical protein
MITDADYEYKYNNTPLLLLKSLNTLKPPQPESLLNRLLSQLNLSKVHKLHISISTTAVLLLQAK